MAKPTIAIFWVAGLLFAAIGAIMILQLPLQEIEAPLTAQSRTLIPALVLFVGGVANLIAWIGALVLSARLGEWAWFVGMLIFGDIALLIFLIFGPDFVYDGDYEDAYDEIRNDSQLGNPNARV
jgi:hypothetical protein